MPPLGVGLVSSSLDTVVVEEIKLEDKNFQTLGPSVSSYPECLSPDGSGVYTISNVNSACSCACVRKNDGGSNSRCGSKPAFELTRMFCQTTYSRSQNTRAGGSMRSP